MSCNRTESLDASHREIMEQSVVLPKECAMTKCFADHLHNVAKKLEEDEDTGSKRYIYVKLGPDPSGMPLTTRQWHVRAQCVLYLPIVI